MIEINRKYSFAWIWRILINWGGSPWEVSVGYYPDYENPTWSLNIKFWRKRRRKW